MDNRITHLSFEDWILFVFCWPEDPAGLSVGNQWQTDEWWDPPKAVIVEYMTRLFAHPVASLAAYSDREIAQGLWDIASDADYGGALSALEVPLGDRLECLSQLANLFRQLLAVRCSDHLGHCSEVGNPLNTICYMWWDVFFFTPAPPEREALMDAVVRSLTAILHLPSMACQEAALHGFGHWREAAPATIQRTIDDWLRRHPELRPELRHYALAARGGCVL